LQPDSHKIWDPGGATQDSTERNELDKITIPFELYMLIANASDVDDNTIDIDENNDNDSRTELDTHANMPVVGRNAYVM
jgi:hypothetical protein